MNFTENAKTKFWADLHAGIKSTFGHSIGEAFHLDQYKSGRFTFTESVTGGPGAVTQLMDSLKASSPIIESVRMTPISNGYNATYNVSVEFDPMKAEAVYSDGKNSVKSFEKDGKTYIVDDDGSAMEVDDADKFMDSLNKTTGSSFKKKENADEVDMDGFPIELDSVIALANEALDGTGVTISKEDGKLVVRGNSELVKPTQQYLPAPSYDMEVMDGGYDDDTGDLVVSVPDYPSDAELEQLRSFLIDAVNYVIDNTLCSKADTCSDDEWCDAMEKAEPCESYARKYGYLGESFVGSDKQKVAVLVKSLLQENRIEEAKAVANKHMGAEMAEGFTRKYAPEKVEEKHSAVITDEMALLDRMHESAMNRAPEKAVEMDSLVAKNLFNKKENV